MKTPAHPQKIAGRGTRLAAIIVDHFLVGLPFLLGAVLASVMEHNMPDDTEGFIALLGILTSAILLVYQFYLLSVNGQTIAKRWFGIQIVDIQSRKPGGFLQNVLLRSILNQILQFIPLYGFVDVLFIFRADRCCIHDHLAGTRVVKT